MTPSTPLPVKTYESAQLARRATDDFYADAGFAYAPDDVQTLLAVYVPDPPMTGAVLDLCCGDGVWSRGLKQLSADLELHGIDISPGGINRARQLLPAHAQRFVVGDVEQPLLWPEETFDLIFARGPGLYNQHSMDRPATIAVIEDWHRTLTAAGRLISVFSSNPQLFGTYTNPLKVKLPYNRAPRLTDAVDFTGGKFHHDATSFLTPFRKAVGVELLNYRFVRNTHILQTRRAPTLEDG